MRAPVVPFPSSRVLALDRLAIELRAAADRLVLPAARAAAAFERERGWRNFGDVRLDDHAREHFGRSGRWLREMVRLHGAVSRFPTLGEAVTGADGSAPIGAEKAKAIARVADDASIGAPTSRSPSSGFSRRTRARAGRGSCTRSSAG